mmetsp:Transcript_86509/g.242234  ORF Transcript_86509/g.242234 Transcript_86509/m.242234 type:complete len:212 (-) Transcript_86509:1022-1657(-)
MTRTEGASSNSPKLARQELDSNMFIASSARRKTSGSGIRETPRTKASTSFRRCCPATNGGLLRANSKRVATTPARGPSQLNRVFGVGSPSLAPGSALSAPFGSPAVAVSSAGTSASTWMKSRRPDCGKRCTMPPPSSKPGQRSPLTMVVQPCGTLFTASVKFALLSETARPQSSELMRAIWSPDSDFIAETLAESTNCWGMNSRPSPASTK